MTGYGLSALFWFVVVLAAIPAGLWLLKRTPIGGGSTGGLRRPGGMKSIAALPLSASQRIVTVEVGHGDARTWLVLGVTAGSITTLHTMAPQDDAPSTTIGGDTMAPASAFSQLLTHLRKDGTRAPR